MSGRAMVDDGWDDGWDDGMTGGAMVDDGWDGRWDGVALWPAIGAIEHVPFNSEI